MSILLDALKKSEKQRQLGQTPTLQTHTGDESGPDDERFKWIVPLLLGVSVCVMGWFGWVQYRIPPAGHGPVIAEAGEPSETVETATPATEQKPRTPTESYRANRSANKQAAPGGLKLPPVMASDKGKRDKTRVNESFKSFQGEEKEQVVKDSVPRDAKPSVARTSDATSRLSQAQPAATTGLSETRSAEAYRPAEDRTAGKPSRVKPHVAEPISYWELPQGVRDNLPEIKISVLVYAERPDDRFLLTNGQRVAEKDELQSGLVLDEIRRDGAIFVYRNYRFLVKG